MILLIKQFSSLYLTALIDWCVARYEAVEQEQTALEKPYTALAQMLSCEPDEIAVVTSATTAWQQVWKNQKCCHDQPPAHDTSLSKITHAYILKQGYWLVHFSSLCGAAY